MTFNLHGWYVLFTEESAAKKTQMVFDKKVMSGRPLSLLVKEPLVKVANATPVKSIASSPIKLQQTPKTASDLVSKNGTPSRRGKALLADSDEEHEQRELKDVSTTTKRGTKKQKISRVISSDEETTAPAAVAVSAIEVVGSPNAPNTEALAFTDAPEDTPVSEQQESPIVSPVVVVSETPETIIEDQVHLVVARSKKRAGKASKRKSDAVGKPAKQPASKKQKKAATAAVDEQEDETLQDSMEVDQVESAPPSANLKSAKLIKASAKSRKARQVEPLNPLSVSDLINSGVAADDEDLYYIRVAAEYALKGHMPELPPDDDEDAPEDQEPADTDEPAPKHQEGCARAHRYYKVPEVEKSAYLPQRNRAVAEVEAAASNATAVATSRSTRVNSRRLVQGMEQHKKGNANATDTDLFQFNQLRTRKKQLKFSKSPIHDWGLYAMEHITQGEMVIEYVGEVIRAQVADIREKWYEKTGIGSSYLFRVDDDAVVDATKKGNLG